MVITFLFFVFGGGKGVRSPLDGLKSSFGKVSCTGSHKIRGQIEEIHISCLEAVIIDETLPRYPESSQP